MDVDEFWARGYAIIHGMYAPEEIEAIRLAAYGSRGYGGDLLANPRLRSVITDGRMAAVTRKLLGTSNLFYGGDSSFTINRTQKGSTRTTQTGLTPKRRTGRALTPSCASASTAKITPSTPEA